ncbi:MAG: hypothetical protein ACXW3D_07840 [Caulobacteraceae bacterium]
MRQRLAALVLGLSLIAAPAFAGPFDDLFFTRAGGRGADMLSARAACSDEVQGVDIGQPGSTGNPDYGVLAAMGARLEQGEDGGKARKLVRRAMLIKCMERKGWAEATPMPEEVKALKKANAAHPEALDAWIAGQAAPTASPAAAPAQAPTSSGS